MVYVEFFPRCARHFVTSKYFLRKLMKRGSHFSYTEKSRAADLDFLYAKKSRGRTCTVDRNVNFLGGRSSRKTQISKCERGFAVQHKLFHDDVMMS